MIDTKLLINKQLVIDIRSAVAELLEEIPPSEHEGHDDSCHVKQARSALNRLDAALAQPAAQGEVVAYRWRTHETIGAWIDGVPSDAERKSRGYKDWIEYAYSRSRAPQQQGNETPASLTSGAAKKRIEPQQQARVTTE